MKLAFKKRSVGVTAVATALTMAMGMFVTAPEAVNADFTVPEFQYASGSNLGTAGGFSIFTRD